MSAETYIIAVLLVALCYAVRPRRRRHRHSWLYRHYLRSPLWKFRRWLWYWTSSRRCEKCRQKLVLHARGVRYRLGAEPMTVHHKHYRNLGHERRGRDVELLCWPCHSRRDAWRHR